MSESSRWNELVPEAFGDGDHPVLRAARGTLILVRINTVDAEDNLLDAQVMAGKLIRANRDEGFVLEMVGTIKGEHLFLPLIPAAFQLIAPGIYVLSDNTAIRDPAFLAAFDVYPSS